MKGLKKWNHISISESYDTIAISLSDSYEIYRIVQEITANIIKHGKASHINFRLTNKEKQIIIEVLDDGNAFDFFKKLQEAQGMGLKNITSRISQIKAKIVQIPLSTGNRIKIYYDVKDSDCG
ncbi:sensor histidine kinase [Chryseobacterium indoltheticum]|uniref:histidine kinase n=1 Tax=Chryseobacterium indoltheticum TaxID=254 RepID=A0A381FBL3_9FLAO|nr:ATP-binding protein [Chryseobacterium indoltheticum]SUX43959.1 Sensor protein vraS [Chryseobacterium indoltheticum]